MNGKKMKEKNRSPANIQTSSYDKHGNSNSNTEDGSNSRSVCAYENQLTAIVYY